MKKFYITIFIAALVLCNINILSSDPIEFRVNTSTNGLQVSPAAAIAPDGSFVITW